MAENLNNKIVNATKWSAITEIMAKLVAPISSMVLARLLTPEAFGVVATLNMIIAFSDIFTDAGFQRYIIQHEFVDEKEKDEATNVAFWSNLLMSFLLWGLIAIFNEPLATLVGNPGLGNVLVVSCVSIPLTAISSIQMALFKRNLDFKALFWRRLAMILVPLCVTIPLAFWMRSYWALVIGTIVTNLVNTLLLTIKSNWRPRLFYSFARLKEMFSFCTWIILLAILTWATNYCDILFISHSLNDYYLGLYKTSISTVGQFTSVITATITPVIFPSISRLQNDIPEMKRVLLRFQKYLSLLILPMGVGIYLFQDLITAIMLGEQWVEAAPIIGLWGIIDVTVLLFANVFSGLSATLGRPNLSVLTQLLLAVILVPAVIISGQYGFTALYVTRALVRIWGILLTLVLVYYLIKLSPLEMIKNILPEMIACVAMFVIAKILLFVNNTILLSLVWVLVCAAVYFLILGFFPKENMMIKDLIYKVKQKYISNLKLKDNKTIN